jgi:hypothetical protein
MLDSSGRRSKVQIEVVNEDVEIVVGSDVCVEWMRYWT